MDGELETQLHQTWSTERAPILRPDLPDAVPEDPAALAEVDAALLQELLTIAGGHRAAGRADLRRPCPPRYHRDSALGHASRTDTPPNNGRR